MKNITVVSLGGGERQLLTLETVDVLRRAKRVILRTQQCDAANYLRETGVQFSSLDSFHEQAEDFDELISMCVKEVLSAAKRTDVVYGVLDPGNDETVAALQSACDITILPGVPLSVPFLCAAKQMGNTQVCAASALDQTDTTKALLITELDSRYLAGDIKLRLLPLYGDHQEVLFFPPAAEGKKRGYRVIPLVELDRQAHYDHRCAALIVPRALEKKERYSFEDLVSVMDILRGEDGCPWDKEQTHQSLRPYVIEEAYEAADAIDEEDWDHAADELGDVLLQVVFHANVGHQYGTMELSDITTAICRKMIARHPHIFLDRTMPAPAWDAFKNKERGLTDASETMMDVSRGLPPLMRAEKVQARAAQVHFDFDSAQDALAKINEEAQEVKEALESGEGIEEEVGDLLFSCVNVARLSGVETETALMRATEKFISRFKAMENMIKTDGKSLKDLTMTEMDVYWNRCKHRPDAH